MDRFQRAVWVVLAGSTSGCGGSTSFSTASGPRRPATIRATLKRRCWGFPRWKRQHGWVTPSSHSSRAVGLDERPFVCHISPPRMWLVDPVMIDFSGERCAKSVRSLSSMTRPQLEAHLESTARASAAIVMVRLRSRVEKVPRTRRHELRRDRWR